ncbi:MAG TPA: glycerol-3-phosphate dehydrogenase/oxidase [Patescibacteria group bacterium]|nr:glycerol-3-phosphate dehydrogenase/oxidase [Patescibacteria group bacterium]
MASTLDRQKSLTRFRDEDFDLAVIGGGINGAAAARDASMRGLKVALIERGDFAGATSSRSSKLIHGGFRYLPQFQFKLVYEALRERERLRHVTAPHLVHPIQFLFPVYKRRGFNRLTMAMGLTMYDLFARVPFKEWHTSLNAAEVRETEPALSREGLTGGAMYFDAWADDARVTFENVLDADLHGAAVANYAAVESFGIAGGTIASVRVRDLLGGITCELRAKAFLNAAGPWVDQIRRMDDPAAKPCVRLTKGVHIVFARTVLPVRESLVLADEQGRIVFVMPHDRYVLVGTTDTDFAGDPATVRTEASDVEYLIAVLAESLPGIKLTKADVATSFAGLRALIREEKEAPSSVPREEVILESPSGLMTVAGGKFTTHREIAEKLVDMAMQRLGRHAGIAPTLKTPLPGARPLEASEDAGGAAALRTMPSAAADILRARYGTRAPIVARIASRRPELAEPLSRNCPAIGAEVVNAVANEMARSVADFLIRRTSLSWRSPVEAEAAAPAVARIMAAELGWDRAREQAEVATFAHEQQIRRVVA